MLLVNVSSCDIFGFKTFPNLSVINCSTLFSNFAKFSCFGQLHRPADL